MKILFASANPYLPQVVGGLEISTAGLGIELQSLGHEIAVLSQLRPGDATWLWNYLKRFFGIKFPHSKYRGLPVYRCWDVKHGLQHIIQTWKPDVILVQGSRVESYALAREAVASGIRTVYYLHDVGRIVRGGSIPDLAGAEWISNSKFTQATLKNFLGIDSEVIRPCILAEQYRTKSTGEFVTLINPRREKGGYIAIEIAEACPDIPFLMVESWVGSDQGVVEIRERASRLGNVTWMSSTDDMQQVYGRTKFIIAPSQLPETWGRVVTEAQYSGLPAVVSDLGALPESLGGAGLVVAADAPIGAWVQAVRRLWTDETEYAEFSRLARLVAEQSSAAAPVVVRQMDLFLRRERGSSVTAS